MIRESQGQTRPGSSGEAFFEVGRYVAVLRRQRHWFLAVAAFMLVSGTVYGLLRTPAYTSVAQVLVEDIDTDPRSGVEPAPSLETEAALVTSTPVAGAARGLMDTEARAGELLAAVSVEPIPEAQALEISYTAADPLVAQRGAQAFSIAYLDVRERRAAGEIARLKSAYRKKLANLNRRLAATADTLASKPSDSSAFRTAESMHNLIRDEIAVVNEQRLVLFTTRIDPGEVILQAAPGTSQGPGLPVIVAAALFLGVFTGMLVALIRDRIDDPIEGRANLEASLRAPVLGIVPRVRRWRDRHRALLVTRTDRNGPVAEAYRAVRTALLMAMKSRARGFQRGGLRHIKTILVVSALEGEGKTSTVANLGTVLAQAGKRVLLVSADLRKPRLHRFFDHEEAPGLEAVLSGQPLQDHVAPMPDVPGVNLLPSGPSGEFPSEFLESDTMSDLLADARSLFDVVLVDCPPLLPVADARILASLVDASVLVVDLNRSSKRAVVQAGADVRRAGGVVLGVILNNVDASSRPEYLAYDGFDASGAAPVTANGGDAPAEATSD